MSLIKSVVSKDKRLVVTLSDVAFDDSVKVILSTLHPVLANAGFDVLEDKHHVVFFGNVQHDGIKVHLDFSQSTTIVSDVLSLIDDYVHDFYFGYYPKVIAVPLHNGEFYIHSTRYGAPFCQHVKPYKRARYK